MEPEGIDLLRQIALYIVVALGVFATWLKVRDAAQTEKQRTRTRWWYDRKWRAIRASRILEAPELVITWLLEMKARADARLNDVDAELSTRPHIYCIALLLLVCVGMFIEGLLTSAPRSPYVFFTLLACFLAMAMHRARNPRVSTKLLVGLSIVAFGSFCLWGYYLQQRTLGLNILASLWLAVSFFIWLMVYRLWSFHPIFKGTWRRALRLNAHFWIILASAISPFVTFVSLSLGHTAHPTGHVPQTLQLLYVNAFCDGLTVIVTWRVLRYAVQPEKKLSIPTAVLLDVAIAAVLAVVALWLSLAFTPKYLTLNQVLNVLVARRPDGAAWEIGPYFWVMHSTFLPTLTYLGLIAACWLGALIVRPAALLLRTGGEVEYPHRLTIALLAFIAAIFLGVRALLP